MITQVCDLINNSYYSTLKRLLLVVTVLSILVGFISYFYSPLVTFLNINHTFKNPSTDIPIVFFGIAIFSLAMIYLQSGKNESIREFINRPGNAEKDKLSRVEIEINKLQNTFKEFESKNTFTEQEKEEIKTNVINKSSIDTIKTIFEENTSNLKDELTNSLGLKAIKDSFYLIIERLNNETNKLYLRANFSLAIGMIISFSGIYILSQGISIFSESTFFIYENEKGLKIQKDISQIFIEMLPRISFVFVVELFAYYFLKLYKAGLDEIKYFQNELTNIESKLIAVEVAYITKNDDAMKEALKILVQTERNFILKKGETTVELERAKSESENMQNILKAVPELFKNKGK